MPCPPCEGPALCNHGENCPHDKPREVTADGIYMAMFWWAVIIVGVAVLARACT